MTPFSVAPSPVIAAGGSVHQYQWTYQGQAYSIAYETLGQGQPVLLLPAFSTVSTRGEMAGLAAQLASQFQVVALDWPGFGQSARPPLDYGPHLYREFLREFVSSVFDQPIAVVAAGHAAGYAVHLAEVPQAVSQLVLVAPTWQGPLRVMGLNQSVRTTVKQTVRSPLLGQALYKLNTTPAFLRFMYRQHVYTDAARLTPGFMAQKYQTTQQPGARFAPAAFVTGALDPVQDRGEFLAGVRSLTVPLLVVIAEQAPGRSKAEMEALATLPQVEIQRLLGSLGLHEEYAEQVAAVVIPFLHRASF